MEMLMDIGKSNRWTKVRKIKGGHSSERLFNAWKLT